MRERRKGPESSNVPEVFRPLREKFDQNLDRWHEMGIISMQKMNHLTCEATWSSLERTVTCIRASLDLMDVNEYTLVP